MNELLPTPVIPMTAMITSLGRGLECDCVRRIMGIWQKVENEEKRRKLERKGLGLPSQPR